MAMTTYLLLFLGSAILLCYLGDDTSQRRQRMKGARRLAALIRKGHPMIGETDQLFLTDGCGCALGAAIIGSGMTVQQYREAGSARPAILGSTLIADLISVPRELASDVSWRHFSGTPRLEIAAWLDTLEPDDKAWAEEQVRKLLEGTPSVEVVNSPAATESK